MDMDRMQCLDTADWTQAASDRVVNISRKYVEIKTL